MTYDFFWPYILISHMWVPDLGLAFRARPVWRAQFRDRLLAPPGFLPAPYIGATAHVRGKAG
jgi:hypothetical protein